MNFNVTTKNQSFDMYMNVLSHISPVFIDLILLHASENGSFDMVYTNTTIDLCMFLNNRKANPVFNVVYRILSDYSEFTGRCPISKVRNALIFCF